MRTGYTRANLRAIIREQAEVLRAVRDADMGGYGLKLVCGELRCLVEGAIEKAERMGGGNDAGHRETEREASNRD